LSNSAATDPDKDKPAADADKGGGDPDKAGGSGESGEEDEGDGGPQAPADYLTDPAPDAVPVPVKAAP